MMGIERNRVNYANASRIQNDSALQEQWQRQNAQNLDLPNSKDAFLLQQKKLKQSKKLSKSNRIQRTQAIDAIDGIDGIGAVDGIQSVDGSDYQVNLANAGRFDMKMDIVDFVRPPHINPDYLNKDILSQSSQNILSQLKIVGASDNLIQRAEILLQEEHSVKSVTDAYKNALIFA